MAEGAVTLSGSSSVTRIKARRRTPLPNLNHPAKAIRLVHGDAPEPLLIAYTEALNRFCSRMKFSDRRIEVI